MIVLTQVSGVATPQNGKSAFYANADGMFALKTSGGQIAYPAAPSLASGLLDVFGNFAVGTTPHWNGTRFVPTPLVAGSTPVPYSTSGNIANVRTVIASGMVPPGTSGYILWSGIPQTFQHLEIVGEEQGVNNFAIQTTSGELVFYFNNDTTGANYASRRLLSSPNLNSNFAADNSSFGTTPINNTGLGNYRGTMHAYIPNYTNGNHKWMYSDYQSVSYSGTQQAAVTYGIQWENTAAIHTVQIFTAAVTVIGSGTVLYLIGVGHTTVNGSGLHGNTKIVNGLVIP